MNITMVSNFLNHHQLPLARELARLTQGKFRFVATERIGEERIALGYADLSGEPFVVQAYDGDWVSAETLLRESDVVILGSCPERLAQIPIRAGILTFRFAERPLRRGLEPLKYLPRLLRWHWRNPVFRPVYLLCAGAYTAGDYRKFGLFRHRAYRWGYFPETRQYSEGDLFAGKDPARLLWVGRMIELKHPDLALEVAWKLKEQGYRFQLDMIGTGELENALREQIQRLGLEEEIHLLGSMPPEQVRKHMERAGIFLFTSDGREGWGAVVNEAMNSGCAVVAQEGAGSLPYLIRSGENGLVLPAGNLDGLVRAAADLLGRPEKQQKLGLPAYRTIVDIWNAEEAARRFLALCEHCLAGERWPDLHKDGPCSREEEEKTRWKG